MLVNTLVQFRGAQVFLSHGNAFYLRLNLVFYLLNLIQILALIIVQKLDVVTWLMASIFADTVLLTLYLFFSRGKKLKKSDRQLSAGMKFSSAAVAATLVDSGMIMISNHFAEPRELSFFVVAISCVSPMIIMYSALQNRLLTDPKRVMRQFSELNFFLAIPTFVVFSIAFYLSISIGVSRIFGDNYSQLANSAVTIILMGYLLLTFKICNTLLRGLDFNSQSLSLSLLLISLFSILCIVVPKSDERLILAANLSMALALLILGISQSIRHDFWRRLFS
jgi:hypothetical protein